MKSSFDVAIVGAGLSGLAAGIRLAHYGRRVAVLERHSRVGGLNSAYRRFGHDFEVGLHAVTNYADAVQRRAPLNRLLRQLRLPRTSIDPCPQRHSLIRFPSAELRFDNDFRSFKSEICATFPAEADRFRALVDRVLAHDCYSLDAPWGSTRAVLEDALNDPLLREMLLMPVMFYGNSTERDMDFTQFCLLFRSLFVEGLWRPRGGMQCLLDLLTDRFAEAGGTLLLGKQVEALELERGEVARVVCADGERMAVDAVVSTAGYPETARLCRPAALDEKSWPPGRLAFVETVFLLDTPVRSFGVSDTIRFENGRGNLEFASPEQAVDAHARVLCMPDNFEGLRAEDVQPAVRATRLANPAAWFAMDRDRYRAAKAEWIDRELAELEPLFPGLRQHVVCSDLFTPVTIHRFTGRINGAVYGSPRKQRNGTTPVQNLFVAGTDQGFLGIVGALMSGVSIVNAHLLHASG